jgi:hypothetical protein
VAAAVAHAPQVLPVLCCAVCLPTPPMRLQPRRGGLPLLLVLWASFPGAAIGRLLLDEDFSCASIGCNATHGITNYSYWRWSTTGSKQSYLRVGAAEHGRQGNEVDFSVTYCPPPNPNPQHLGCYRSELALQRRNQGKLIDWRRGLGSSERWFGFSNRLLNFRWAPSPQTPPHCLAPSTKLQLMEIICACVLACVAAGTRRTRSTGRPSSCTAEAESRSGSPSTPC